MKFPSIEVLIRESKNTLFRFPAELLVAMIGAGVWIYMIQLDIYRENDFYIKVLMTCVLGLSLYFSADLLAESKGLRKKRWLLYGVVTGFLIVYFFTLEDKLSEKAFIKFSLLLLSFHLLVSFSPYIGKGNLNGFWQFNKTLFIRILTAALFSGVFYLGLAGALAAIDALFNVDIESKVYYQLWTFIAGVFNTWFFLSGVPKDFNELEESHAYPKGLKVFTQYVLIPLVCIYLIILYAYEAKIIAEWSLPKGWVSYLVIGYAVVGILSILLIYPIRNMEGNKWIHIFSKWFYFAIFPLVVLLFVAIGTRVKEYGITENRYFILVLAIWLAFVAGYFLFSKAQNIKIIPITLFFIALLACWGPQSAFNVSKVSQMSRLKRLLSKNGLFVDGKIKKATKGIPFEEEQNISTIVDYLQGNHGVKSLQPLYKESLDSIQLGRYDSPDTLMRMMGLSYISRWQTEKNSSKYFQLKEEEEQIFDVSNYDYLIRLDGYDSMKEFKTKSGLWKIFENSSTNKITIEFDKVDKLNFDLKKLASTLASKYSSAENYSLSSQQLSIMDSSKNYEGKLILQSLTVYDENASNSKDKFSISYNGHLLIRKK